MVLQFLRVIFGNDPHHEYQFFTFARDPSILSQITSGGVSEVSDASLHTRQIKAFARQLGFDHCGIARARRLESDARRLEQWLHNGYHAGMEYMERHFDTRVDPGRIVEGARSVITLLVNYFPNVQQPTDAPRVARYAYGKDYHDVIRNKLNRLLGLIREHIGSVEGRGTVDSAPVLERSWAALGGLGWVGKNANLLHKQAGSYFFIATLITDLELEYDAPFTRDGDRQQPLHLLSYH
jgi:epoxyqueuosine reductase